MRAEIVTVGTELLLGQIVDTNAAALSRALSGLGIGLYRRVTVGDNRERMLAAFRSALAENDIVFAIGGLGPTMDDITRDVLAEAIGDTLVFSEEIAARLRTFFESRGLPVLESNLRQAMVPTHGRPIENPNGTAPGLLFEKDGRIAIALPGPPGEFLPMLEDHVVPYLRRKVGASTILSRVVRVCGMGESLVEHHLRDLMTGDNPTVAPYAKTGEVHLRVTARAPSPEEAEQLIAPMVEAIRARLGRHVYALDDEPLESAVLSLLAARGLTLAVAESCTGGMLAGRITDVPGSSRAFVGGAITYSNALKSLLLGVDPGLLEAHGAVSAEVAEAMARGARERFGADMALSITGIAGPEGGSAEKPVGLVYIGLAHVTGVEVTRNQFIGRRQEVRYRATQAALTLLRDHLLALELECPPTDEETPTEERLPAYDG
jgi:nicotinamide-nucleotide amidase